MPNGVDLETFTSSTAELPVDLRWVEQTPTFVFAGAHGPANGLDLVLEAADRLRRKVRDDIHILLVGDGPSKKGLQQQAQRLELENVVFYDPVPKQTIPAILNSCAGGLMVLKDVELFRYGVSPNKLFDYLASDLPVVTNVPGDVARIVEDANAGVVVPPGDADALADAMIKVADGTVAGGSGARYVTEHRDRRLLADRLARVIDAVAR